MPPPPAPPPGPRPPRPSGSEILVRTLTFLGVALVFAGLLGFVIFAFGDLGKGWRPLAEVLTPVALFGGAALLRRLRAPFAGTALEVLGGLAVPVMAAAAFLDGATPPPDPTGRTLAVALAASGLAITAAYAAVTLRRPTSPLRFLVAPMLWVSVAAAGLVFSSDMPTGRHVLAPKAAQWALVAVAIALTTAAVRRSPQAVLSRAATVALLPGALLAELVVLTAGVSGTPVAALLVAGAATAVTVELAPVGLPAVGRSLLQGAVVVVTAAAVAPAWGAGWAAAAAALALLALSEWQALRRPDPVADALLLVGAAVAGLGIAGIEPASLLTVSAVGLGWAVLRRARPRPALAPATAVVALALTTVTLLAACGGLWPVDAVLVGAGAVTLVVAVVVRAWALVRRDTVAQWWTLSAPVGVAALVTGAVGEGADVERPWLGAAAALLAAAAIATGPRWPVGRVWTAGAAAAVAVGWAAVAADLGAAGGGLLLASVGAVSVVLASGTGRRVGGHVVLAGAVATLSGFGVVVGVPPLGEPYPWTAATAALAVVAGAWALITVVGEWRGSPARDLLVHLGGHVPDGRVDPAGPPYGLAPIAPALALAAVIALPPTAMLAAGTAGDDAWLPVMAAAVALVAVVLGRPIAARRPAVGAVLSEGGVWTTLGLAVWCAAVAGTGWAPVVATLAFVVAVLVVAPRHRHAASWLAWAAGGVATVQAAAAAGVAPRDLGFVAFVWAAVVMVGGLAADDALAGRRAPGEWVRTSWLRPAVLYGAVVAPLALVPVYERTPTTFGWWSLAAAGVALVVAVQTHLGIVSLVTWIEGGIAYAALAPWEPLDHPWTLVPLAALLLVIAEIARRLDGQGGDDAGPPDELRRWDLPAFVAAHAAALAALAATAVHGDVVASWLSVGALGLVVGVRLRAAGWVIGGTAVALVGAGAAGPGWLALALLLVAVAATVAAGREEGTTRAGLQATGSVATAGAWIALGTWMGWDVETQVLACAAAGGAGLLLLAGLGRFARLGGDWLAAWLWLPAASVVVAAVAATDPDVPSRPATFVLAGALAAAAVSAGALAEPLATRWARPLAALLAVAATGTLLAGLDAGPTAVLAVATSASAVVHAASVVLQRVDRRRWVPSGFVVVGLSGLAAAGAAAALWPARWPTVVVLLVAGVELVGVGLVDHRPAWFQGAVASVTAAWLVIAAGSLTGDPQWFTVPLGLAVLAVVGIARHDRRRRQVLVPDPWLSLLDLAGMGLLVGAAVVQTVTVSAGWALVALACGLGLIAFGLLTRVRRRLAFGAATVGLALFLIVVPPLVGLVPEASGWTPWALIAGLGLLAILVAALLERGRRAVRSAIRRFRQLTAGWE